MLQLYFSCKLNQLALVGSIYNNGVDSFLFVHIFILLCVKYYFKFEKYVIY